MENVNDVTVRGESCDFQDGKLVSKGIEVKTLDWFKESDDPIAKHLLENKGLGFFHPGYVQVRSEQNQIKEYEKICEFLSEYMLYYADKHDVNVQDLSLEFINHGKMELVFVFKDEVGNCFTLLVKQPTVLSEEIYLEMRNLKKLNTIDNKVLVPLDYFSKGEQVLYVTPYINQARCIASTSAWGVYIPEPFYRFEVFTEKQERVIVSCMIAKLISFYDLEAGEGLSACKLGGGDFMLPKGFENRAITVNSIYNKLYLVAARKKVKCSLNDYIEIIRDEFSQSTIDKNQDELVINLRGRVPMKKEYIEAGIELGLKKLHKISTGKNKKMLKKMVEI